MQLEGKGTPFCDIVIRYNVYSEPHTRAGLNIQHVIYEQQARVGQNTQPTKVGEVNYK